MARSRLSCAERMLWASSELRSNACPSSADEDEDEDEEEEEAGEDEAASSFLMFPLEAGVGVEEAGAALVVVVGGAGVAATGTTEALLSLVVSGAAWTSDEDEDVLPLVDCC